MNPSRRFSERWSRRVRVAACIPLLWGAGCTEQSFTERRRVDVFQQERRNAVDLLVIVDNSCSMVEEQDNLAKNFRSLIDIFEPADVDWRIAVATTDVQNAQFRGLLVGGDDEIVVRGPAGEIDRVEYTRAWTFAAGTSLQLDASSTSWSGNDGVDAWCASSASFGDGSFGSPGARNAACSGAAPAEPTGATPDVVRAPVVGEVVVTEIMARSAGLDSQCEWFELTNTTAVTLDLSGVEIRDLGRNHATFAAGTLLAPFDAMVVGRSVDLAANCGTPVDVAFPVDLSTGAGFTLNHDERVITRETPDGEELFSELVAQGTSGTGIEMGLEASRLVFESPYVEQNPEFLREDANFSVLYVSDENDMSPYPADAYVRYLTELKGDRAYRDRSVVNLSAVIGRDVPLSVNQPSCESPNGFASYGERYVVAVNETQGLVESICEEDFAPIISELGLTLSGLSAEFELSDWPQLDTLAVELYAADDDEEKIRDLVIGVDFSYIAQGNLLRFNEAQLPPSETWIVAKYELSVTPNTENVPGSEETQEVP